MVCILLKLKAESYYLGGTQQHQHATKTGSESKNWLLYPVSRLRAHTGTRISPPASAGDSLHSLFSLAGLWLALCGYGWTMTCPGGLE